MKVIESLEGEIWKDIKDYEGLYQVSNYSRIKSLDRFVRGRTPKMHIKEKVLKQILDKGMGYLTVSLYKEGNMTRHTVHRLVALTFLDNPDGKSQVNHINGIKTDNILSNLEWATPAENSQHAWVNGLNKRSKSNTELIVASRGKKVIDTSTGKIYASVRSAAKVFGMCNVTLLDKLKGKTQNNTNLIFYY